MWISSAARNLGSGFWDTVSHFFGVAGTIFWDTGLSLINLITPKKRLLATQWPEYIPPTKTDSRSPCPALNALRCLLPRDGKNITFKQLGDEVNKHFNFAPSFCYFVCNYMARILKRNYNTDTLDLNDLSVHNGIEHDGSITRYDTIVQPNQGIPDEGLINDLISASKDGKKLTPADLSRIITTRLSHSKRTNGQFSISSFQMFFAAANASTLLLILGGDIEDIKPFLLEERIPEGWSNKMRARAGLTMGAFNSTVSRVLLGIDPSWKKVKKTA
ncbi:heme-thiolate peroxidase [Ramaria rubella]|nr:heme-thiolate peroxidase [Ramaria rubella]KAF8578266.1 heme-thiolate peroxidase [Ramaria rubella]